MYQLFSRPDRYCATCGNLYATVAVHRIPEAPAFLHGLRILFAGDFHILGRTLDADITALAALMASTAPDIILLGGDYGDCAIPAKRLFQGLSDLRPPMGAFGVIGNNDAEAWQGRLHELQHTMSVAGFQLLINQSVPLSINDGILYIAGVDEYRYGNPDVHGLYPSHPSPDVFRVVLSHYPRIPDPAPDLVLSGHTHGGQINLFGITPFTIGFERLFHSHLASKAVVGMHRFGDTSLLVTKGIGASRIQLRFCVQPEIELLCF